MKVSRVLSMLVAVILLVPASAFAAQINQMEATYTISLTQDFTPSPWTQETGYVDRSRGKLVFGAKNTLLGITELYNEPHQAVVGHEGFFRGMGRGIVNMLGDTLGGAVQLSTFPITGVDVALPEGGTDVL